MDTEYILDCSLELAETTALEYAILSDPKGGYRLVRQMVDENLAFPANFLANTARQTLQGAPQPLQHRFALAAIPVLKTSLERWKERMAFIVQKQLQEDLGVREVLRLSPASSLNALQTAPTARFVAHEVEISEGVVRQVLDHHFADAAFRWQEDCRVIESALQWVAQQGPQAWHQLGLAAEDFKAPAVPDSPETGLAATGLLGWLRQEKVRQQKAKQAQERSLVQRAKSAIKKATKLFEQIGLGQELTLFVSGQEVVLSRPGAPLKLVVKPLSVQGWLLDRTQVGRSHTPYELRVLTASDVHVAKLCVYFKDTPVLDQLLALSLFVQSGQELELLEKANWFAYESTPESVRREVAQAYPSLKNKFPTKRSSQPAGFKMRLPAAFDAQEHHWEPFKGRVEQWIATWLEPLHARALEFEGAEHLVRQAMLSRHAKLADPREFLALAA